jgi:hypothetical protein
MNRREWIRSGLLISVLIILSVLVAQSRRNCEIPGSTWVPCIGGKPAKNTFQFQRVSTTGDEQTTDPMLSAPNSREA